MSTQILTTKLFIPPVRPQTVERPRLIEQMNHGLYTKLILVSASAGFGKSTLLSQWIKQSDYPTAWVSLDEPDSDVTRFLTYMVMALQTIDGTIGETVLTALQSPERPPTDVILTDLINAIASVRQDIILVLDDYHTIDNTEIDTALAFLLDYLPPQCHLVISTREDPQLPLARLRARGELTEIRIADLRFNADEASDFLRQTMNLSLTPEDIVALEKRTEGWIAGLQLAALSLRRRDDTSDFIQAFTGSHRFVLEYLVEEVLRHQPDTLRDFLLQTSILERFNADLCDAVVEHDSSKDLLATLDRANVFVIPLDETQRWYRYHHLFADALRSHLENEQSDRISDLHLRASEWFEAHDYAPESIQHALKAETFDRAADLIEIIWPEMDENYQLPTWLRWLKALPEHIVKSRPILGLGHAWAMLNLGDVEASAELLAEAEHWLEKSQDELEQMVVIDISRFQSLPATIAGARAYGALTMGQPEAGIEFAKKARDLAPSHDHSSYRQGLALLGVAYWALGDLLTADQILEEHAKEIYELGYISDGIGMSFLLGEMRLTLGKLQFALNGYEQWLPVIEELDEEVELGAPDVHRGLAEVYCEINELDKAEQYLQSAKDMSKHSALPNWQYRYALVYAKLCVRRGQYDDALQWLDDAGKSLTPAPLPISRSVNALRASIWIRQGHLDKAQAWLHTNNLSLEDDINYLNEFNYLMWGRLLLAQSKTGLDVSSQIETLLNRLQASAKTGQRNGTLIEILIVLALFHQLQGDMDTAVASIEQALDLAAPEGFINIFTDEGASMATLLEEARQQGIHINFVSKLLSVIKSTDTPSQPAQDLIDPLSDRELEVLHMLKTDLTGPQIADQLMVSLNTMRTHTKNIYSKLGVGSRRTAVTRAEELGLF